jgi:hypothetical protein
VRHRWRWPSQRSRQSLGCFFAPQEIGDRIDETLPRRLVREDQVVLALERHEASVTDLTRQHQAVLEGHPSVPPAVHHERWNGDLRQQLRDVDVADDAQ